MANSLRPFRAWRKTEPVIGRKEMEHEWLEGRRSEVTHFCCKRSDSFQLSKLISSERNVRQLAAQ